MAITESKQQQAGDLLARISLRNQPALKALYALAGGQLYAVALRIVRKPQLAEEVVQDVFVNVWNRAQDYAAVRSQPMTWLISLTRNRAIDVYRAQDDAVSLSTHLDDEDGEMWDPEDSNAKTPLQQMIGKAESAQLQICLRALEAQQRQTLALAYFHGMSHAELAAHLAQPLGTIKTWARRGMERLAACMQSAGHAPVCA